MRTYADSSFIVKLISAEPDSDQVIAEYRRLGRPALFFLPIHTLEVRNAILQRAFHERRSTANRQHIARVRDAALSRLNLLLSRGALLDVTHETDAAIALAAELAIVHTERLGVRAIDLLHVASARLLKCERFLTTDVRQAELARAEGLAVSPI